MEAPIGIEFSKLHPEDDIRSGWNDIHSIRLVEIYKLASGVNLVGWKLTELERKFVLGRRDVAYPPPLGYAMER